MQINNRVGLSPGKETSKLAAGFEEKTEKRRELIKTPQAKRRRLQLKAERLSSNYAKETREGETYSSGIAFDNDKGNHLPFPNSIAIKNT